MGKRQIGDDRHLSLLTVAGGGAQHRRDARPMGHVNRAIAQPFHQGFSGAGRYVAGVLLQLVTGTCPEGVVVPPRPSRPDHAEAVRKLADRR